jgi:hypothetical protein
MWVIEAVYLAVLAAFPPAPSQQVHVNRGSSLYAISPLFTYTQYSVLHYRWQGNGKSVPVKLRRLVFSVRYEYHLRIKSKAIPLTDCAGLCFQCSTNIIYI